MSNFLVIYKCITCPSTCPNSLKKYIISQLVTTIFVVYKTIERHYNLVLAWSWKPLAIRIVYEHMHGLIYKALVPRHYDIICHGCNV